MLNTHRTSRDAAALRQLGFGLKRGGSGVISFEECDLNDEERHKLVSERVRKLRTDLGLNQTEFARFIGIPNGQSQVSRWERGEGAPDSRNAALLAAKGNGDPLYYQGLEPIDPHGASHVAMDTVRIVGEVQAGEWRESIEWPEDDQYEFPIAAGFDLPKYNMKGFVVRGESMNRVYPDGSFVFVADLMTNPIEPRHGDIVLVDRRNKRGEHEASLKRMQVQPTGEVWLCPESTSLHHQQPLSLQRDKDESFDVRISGVVVFEFVSRRSFQFNAVGSAPTDAAQARVQEVMRRHNRGDSHPKIAADLGISRERVRQIVKENGGKPRSEQKAQRLRVVKTDE